MSESFRPNGRTANLRKKLQTGILASSFALAALTAYFMFWQLIRPYPLHSRETADLFGTALLLKGQNPFSLNLHPSYLYIYGIIHTLLAYPFAAYFGNSFFLHRVMGDLFVILSGVVLFWGMKASRVPLPLALCGALLFFSHIGFNDFSSAPDSLGLFFMLLSLVVPYAWNFNWPSVMAGGFFTVLAFYTKEYFVIGAPLLMTFLFLFRSKAKGLVLGLVFSFVMAISIWQINRWLPLYFTDVFYFQLNLGGFEAHSWGHELRVAAIYFPLGIGLIAILVWQLRNFVRETKTLHLWPPQINVLDLQKPFFLKPAMHWVTFILVICTAVWVFKMGQNGGNLMGYVYHLLTPFIIWRACIVLGVELPELIGPLVCFQAAIVLVAGFLAIPMLTLHQHDDTVSWQHAADVISRHRDVLNAGALSVILWNQGKPVYDDGDTEYYPLSFAHNPSGILEAYRIRCREFQDTLEQKVRHKEFDAVMIFAEDVPSPLVSRELLSQYYQKTETFSLTMPFEKLHMDVWEPLPPAAP